MQQNKSKQIQQVAQKGFTLTELAFSVAIMSIISVAVSTLLTASYQAQMTHRTSALVESISMNFTEQLRRDARLAIAVGASNNIGARGTTLSTDIPANSTVPLTQSGNRIDFYYLRNPNGTVNTGARVVYIVDNAAGIRRLFRQASYDPESRANTFSQSVFVGLQADGQPDINGLVARCLNLQPNNNNSGNNLNEGNACFRFTTTPLYSSPNPQVPGQFLQSTLTRVTINGLQIGPDPDDPTPIIFPVDAFGRPVYNIRQTSFELGGAKVFR